MNSNLTAFLECNQIWSLWILTVMQHTGRTNKPRLTSIALDGVEHGVSDFVITVISLSL